MCQPCAVTVLPSLIFVPYVRIMVRMAGERQLTPREGTIYVVFVTACVLHELNTQSHTGSFVILVCMFEKITEEAYWRLIRGSTQSVLSVPVTPDGNSHVLALSTHTTKCRQSMQSKQSKHFSFRQTARSFFSISSDNPVSTGMSYPGPNVVSH